MFDNFSPSRRLYQIRAYSGLILVILLGVHWPDRTTGAATRFPSIPDAGMHAVSKSETPNKVNSPAPTAEAENVEDLPGIPKAVPGDRASVVGLAVIRGVTFLENNDPSGVEDAFIVMHLKLQAQRQGLEVFIQKAREMYQNDPSRWYITSGSPKISFPESPTTGKDRLQLITNAPHLEPVEKATQLLVDFLTADLNGYLLTQQKFMLEIAKSRKIELPETVNPNGSHYIAKMVEELNKSNGFSYLSARQTLFILLYSLPSEADASRWIDAILKSQELDGSWHDDRPITLQLGGETFVEQPTHVRTTAYATYALTAYIKKYLDPTSEVKPEELLDVIRKR